MIGLHDKGKANEVSLMLFIITVKQKRGYNSGVWYSFQLIIEISYINKSYLRVSADKAVDHVLLIHFL